MADLTPAEELRAAAAQMREHAEAARALTEDGNGEWFPWGVVQQTRWVDWPEPRPVPVPFAFDDSTELAEGGNEPTGEAFVAHARWEHDSEEAWHGCEFFAGPMPEPLAEYIARMHPDVVLAIADWLDAEAGRPGVRIYNSLSPGPLAVARACLGTKENNDA